MVFKETLETPIETEREVQKFLTYLEEHKYHSKRHMDSGKIIKAYAEEIKIERSLLFLTNFLNSQITESQKELRNFKKGVAAESLKLKCKQIDDWVRAEFLIEDNEDFGEED